MRLRLVPLRHMLALSREDVRLLCLSQRGVRRAAEALGIPRSTAYRRLARLRRLGFEGPGIYLPVSAFDGAVRVLERPALVVLPNGRCIHVDGCDLNCPACPRLARDGPAFAELGYLTPAEALRDLARRAVDRLGGMTLEVT